MDKLVEKEVIQILQKIVDKLKFMKENALSGKFTVVVHTKDGIPLTCEYAILEMEQIERRRKRALEKKDEKN